MTNKNLSWLCMGNGKSLPIPKQIPFFFHPYSSACYNYRNCNWFPKKKKKFVIIIIIVPDSILCVWPFLLFVAGWLLTAKRSALNRILSTTQQQGMNAERVMVSSLAGFVYGGSAIHDLEWPQMRSNESSNGKVWAPAGFIPLVGPRYRRGPPGLDSPALALLSRHLPSLPRRSGDERGAVQQRYSGTAGKSRTV